MRERKLAKNELKKLKTENEVVYIDDEENNYNKANKIKKSDKQASKQLDIVKMMTKG